MTGKQVWWVCGSAVALCIVMITAMGIYMMRDAFDFGGGMYGGYAGHGYPPGPTVQVALPSDVDDPTDFDAMPAAAVMNGSDSSSLPTRFERGHVNVQAAPSQQPVKTRDTTMVTLGQTQVPTPAYANGMIFSSAGFTGMDFCAVNLRTGRLAWRATLSDDGPSTATVQDDYVLVNTESCTLFCLDAATGEQRWSAYLGDPTISTPTVYEGRVYTAYPAGGGAQAQVTGTVTDSSGQTTSVNKTIGATHAMICMDLKRGGVIWQHRIDGDLITAPAIAGDRVYAATFSGTLYAFDRKSGVMLAARHNQVTSVPTPMGEHIYFTRRSGAKGRPHEQVVRADPETLVVDRVLVERPSPHLDAAIQSGSLYALEGQQLDAGNGFGEAPEAANSAQAQENIGLGNVSTMQAYQGSRVTVGDGTLYSTMGDTVLAIDPADGSLKWERKLDGDLSREGGTLGSPPAFADGKLVYGTVTGQVVLADSKTGETLEWWAVGEAIRAQPLVVEGKIVAPSVNGRLHIIDTGNAALDGWAEWGGDARHSGTLEGS